MSDQQQPGKNNPDPPSAYRLHLELVKNAYAAGDFGETIRLAEDGLGRWGGNPCLHLYKAWAILLCEDCEPPYEDALESLLAAVEFDAGGVRARFELAMYFYGQGRRRDALEVFEGVRGTLTEVAAEFKELITSVEAGPEGGAAAPAEADAPA